MKRKIITRTNTLVKQKDLNALISYLSYIDAECSIILICNESFNYTK